MSCYGEISVVGLANAGKSTLINSVVQHKISIVTRKRNTTNRLVRAIYTDSGVQIIFVDTPGLVSISTKDACLLSAIKQQLRDVNFIALVVDSASGFKPLHKRLINILKVFNKKMYCILNKIDIIPKGSLLLLAQEFNDYYSFSRTFMVSAITGDGVDSMLSIMCSDTSCGEHRYGKTMLTDLQFDVWLAEITREFVLDRVHDEIPYKTKVITTTYTQESGVIVVNQSIVVEKYHHKAILLGVGGNVIKYIGECARKQMSQLLNRPVRLFLEVLHSN